MKTDNFTCEGCSEVTPSYNSVHYGTSDGRRRHLCSKCFNAEVAARSGQENFENIQFKPMGLVDCQGQEHEFHFRTHLLGGIVSLEAFELRNGDPGGYEFQIIGKPEEDLFGILGRLIEKMRRRLAIAHVTEDERYGLQIADSIVRGQIDSDQSTMDRTPLIVVDGREISWEQFGQMLMTFEGSQFKLEILDPSDEA